MILRFPSQSILRLTLTLELIDAKIQCTPARFGIGEAGDVWIESAQSISRATVRDLKKYGVQSKRSLRVNLREAVSWHQALLLVRDDDAEAKGEEGDVLFEMDDDADLAFLVQEMLRLGNDRQSVRHLIESGMRKTLLRVNSPPYYTLSRVSEDLVDRSNEHTVGRQSHRNRAAIEDTCPPGSGCSLLAYVQQSARVWVPWGYRHPMGERLIPPPGKWLLISKDSQWRFIQEGKFQDIYVKLDFQLPEQRSDYQDALLNQRISIPLTLTQSDSQEPAELWVLNHDALSQVESLIRQSDDQLISRLTFAVADQQLGSQEPIERQAGMHANPVVVLRLRPSKQPPPVLVLNAIACRCYLQIPHLFFPVGSRLLPPLRRDAVVDVFGQEEDRLTWLVPDDSDRFARCSIPDSAFRPLSDWVDYVMDQQSVALQAWVASHQFDFQHFVCEDKSAAGQRLPDLRPKAAEDLRPKVAEDLSPEKEISLEVGESEKTSRKVVEKASAVQRVAKITEARTIQPEETHFAIELRVLEKQFLESDDTIESAQRDRWWEQMGVLHAELGHRRDMTVCWVNALWNESNSSLEKIERWLACEQSFSSAKQPTIESIGELIEGGSEDLSKASFVAAFLVWAAAQKQPPIGFSALQPKLSQFLHEHEGDLPVRASWMAWVALSEISGRDSLLLARARDRTLERLFHRGLMPEMDMASFMHGGAGNDDGRFRLLRTQIADLREVVQAWIVEPAPPIAIDPQTKCYADLILAYAIARLGDSSLCRRVLSEVDTRLNSQDAIHGWVRRAFQKRIDEVLEGRLERGSLSEELTRELHSMDRLDRYKLDRLRQQSRILEPNVHIDAFQNWHQGDADIRIRELWLLRDVVDRDELERGISKLLKQYPRSEDRVILLPETLQLSARVGENFAIELLSVVSAVIREDCPSFDRTLMLHSALRVSAHFGRADLVEGFTEDLSAVMPELIRDYLAMEIQPPPEQVEKAAAIESLFSQSFRGLRKLGMRDEIGRLYGLISDLIQSAPRASRSRKNRDDSVTRRERLLLCLATGWYYFNVDGSARSVVDNVRANLRSGNLAAMERKKLTLGYLEAIAEAPIEESLARVRELLAVDKNGVPKFPPIHDQMTTASHFSISQLAVVEQAILSLTGEELVQSPSARRWLEEDEFVVRARIHRDLRLAEA